MARKALTDKQKKIIEAERINKTALEIANQFNGIGEKTVQKYINSLDPVQPVIDPNVELQKAREEIAQLQNQLATLTPKPQKDQNGYAIMDQSTSKSLDEIVGRSKLDLSDRASAINKNKPIPKGVILNNE